MNRHHGWMTPGVSVGTLIPASFSNPYCSIDMLNHHENFRCGARLPVG